MSDYTVDRIYRRKSFHVGPLRAGRTKRTPFVIGFDSEAEDGRPFMFQFSLPGTPEEETLLIPIRRKKFAGLHALMDVVHEHCTKRDREYLIFGFNLTYEYTQLFGDFDPVVRLSDEFVIPYEWNADGKPESYRIHVRNNKRHFLTIRNMRTHVDVRFYDAASFFPTSLAKAAKAIGLPDKLGKPPAFTRREARTERFKAYARRDAFITRLLGEQIIRWHEEYDVRTCISAPHFASSVFRRQFLRTSIPILHDRELEQYGLWTYHGGKNGYYRDGPQAIPNVFNYDIRSAYPEAMRQLPDVEQATWEKVDQFVPGSHGVYRARLAYHPCRFRGLQTIGGSWDTPEGEIDPAFVTGYELDTMLAHGEIEIIEADGWIATGPSGGALVEYVDRFYEQKRTATDETLKLLAKLLLNSLYGKFFQKTPLGEVGMITVSDNGEMGWVTTDPSQPYDFKAGGLYHPPIASLITGYVRAKIHRMEHKYDAIMTSTDGIFATVPPDAGDLGTDLGMLDATRGDLRIWRERLYLFDAIDHRVEECDDENCKAHKYALHGFRGDARKLAAIPLARGVYRYSGKQVVTLALSTKMLDGSQYDPGRFVDRPFDLALT